MLRSNFVSNQRAKGASPLTTCCSPGQPIGAQTLSDSLKDRAASLLKQRLWPAFLMLDLGEAKHISAFVTAYKGSSRKVLRSVSRYMSVRLLTIV